MIDLQMYIVIGQHSVCEGGSGVSREIVLQMVETSHISSSRKKHIFALHVGISQVGVTQTVLQLSVQLQ